MAVGVSSSGGLRSSGSIDGQFLLQRHLFGKINGEAIRRVQSKRRLMPVDVS